MNSRSHSLAILIGLFSIQYSTASALLDPPPSRAVQAARQGGVQGGGGQTEEIPLFEIRQDLRRWIMVGGASALELPQGVSLAQYVSDMIAWLEPGVVSITLTDEAISVAGKPKDCRSFIEEKTELPQIICNRSILGKSIERQYQLIHHEFAALAGFERNIGAASDYFISVQISDSLENITIKRLVIKKPRVQTQYSCQADFTVSLSGVKIGGESIYKNIPIDANSLEWANVLNQLRRKGYDIRSDGSLANTKSLHFVFVFKDRDETTSNSIDSEPFSFSYQELNRWISIFNRSSADVAYQRAWEKHRSSGIAATPLSIVLGFKKGTVTGDLVYGNLANYYTQLRSFGLQATLRTIDTSNRRLEKRIARAKATLLQAQNLSERGEAELLLQELLRKRTYIGEDRDAIQNFVHQIPDCKTILGK